MKGLMDICPTAVRFHLYILIFNEAYGQTFSCNNLLFTKYLPFLVCFFFKKKPISSIQENNFIQEFE